MHQRRLCAKGAEDAMLGICAGRERADGVECWVAVTTEAYAQEIISEMPLFRNGDYVPQTKEVLADIGNRIWDALKTVLQPFFGNLLPARPLQERDALIPLLACPATDA